MPIYTPKPTNTPPMSTPSENQVPTPPTPEQRDHLLKLFTAAPGEKPLTREQFREIKPYLDFRKGGIHHTAFDLLRDDKEVIQAAKKHRAIYIQEVKEFQAAGKERRDLILKALNARPGQKPLTPSEFKEVADFLDRKKGGLRRDIYEAFRDDQEILDAAKSHREVWQSKTAKGAGKEAPEQPQPSPAAQKPGQIVGPHAPAIKEDTKTQPNPAAEAPSQAAPKSKLRQRLEKRNAGASHSPDRSQEMEP